MGYSCTKNVPHTCLFFLVSGNTLEACKQRSPGFINIGRGDIITNESLITALQQKWISAAFLDVFEQEPLPPSSPLWDMDNVTITPHIAGPSPIGQVAKSFGDNVVRYVTGAPLKRVFDWHKLY